MKDFVGWLFTGLCIAYLIFILRRWMAAIRPQLAEGECVEFAGVVLDDLFEKTSRVQEFVGVDSSYWQSLGLSVTQWIYLCRWMNRRGLVSTPRGWGWNQIIMNDPPKGLALMKNTWKLLKESKIQPSISIGSIGDVNGPINVGGEQIAIFGQGLSGDNLQALVEALRRDAEDMSEPRASSLHEAANTLEDAVEGREPATSPAVTGALKWVRQCVTDAVGNAGGEALLAATVAVARTLGWV